MHVDIHKKVEIAETFLEVLMQLQLRERPHSKQTNNNSIINKANTPNKWPKKTMQNYCNGFPKSIHDEYYCETTIERRARNWGQPSRGRWEEGAYITITAWADSHTKTYS